MRQVAVALALVFLPSCLATAGDLRDIATAIEERDRDIAEAVERGRQGELTPEEVRSAVRDENAELREAVEGVARRIQERGQEIAEGVPKSGDPLEWVLWGSGILTALGAGAEAKRRATKDAARLAEQAAQDMSRKRDYARAMRHEPVAVPTPSPPAQPYG